MPKIVKAPPHNHPPAGKCHDLANPCPVLLAVAVNAAILAGRFRVDGAFAPLLQGVGYQSGAFDAELRIAADDSCARNGNPGLVIVFCPAEDPDEVEEDLQVLFLGAR